MILLLKWLQSNINFQSEKFCFYNYVFSPEESSMFYLENKNKIPKPWISKEKCACAPSLCISCREMKNMSFTKQMSILCQTHVFVIYLAKLG